MTFGAIPLSTILVCVACALLAVAIFAPRKPLVPAISYAPAVTESAAAATAYESPRPAYDLAPLPEVPAEPEPEAEPEREIPADAAVPWTWAEVPVVAEPTWPELVDPLAAGASVATRSALVAALATLGTPWSTIVLEHARVDEPDTGVRQAIDDALSASSAAA